MDAKITLSFDEQIIRKAKQFADAQNISLSRLTEFIFSKITTSNYAQLEDLPLADWVNSVAEGPAEYKIKVKSRKAMKNEFFKGKKK